MAEYSIKNMVCARCISVVTAIFEKEKIVLQSVTLGKVKTEEELSASEQKRITKHLEAEGFEWLNDHKKKQIEKIKNLLIEKAQSNSVEEHFSVSSFLSKELNKDYSSISRLFSEAEGVTIEQFFILQKIEKVKELLIYDEMNLNEISYRLGYSSAAHLSAQFKKITGLSPREFKNIGGKRKPLDKI